MQTSARDPFTCSPCACPHPSSFLQPPMNVLFLDIDGVLNSRATAGSYCIDPVLSARFIELVRATNAIVVLSSTHRLDQELRCAILAAGIVFDDSTPDLPTQTRADEITAWLREHPE